MNITRPRSSARRRATAASLALVACAALAGCGDDASADGLTPIKFRTDIFYNGGHLPLIAGIEEGIYEKHGLKVTAQEGTGSGTTAQTVGTGSDDIGFADGSVLVQSIGKGVDATMILGLYQTNPTAVALQQDSGIESLKDLEGKTGGFATGSAMELLFPALAAKEGVGVDSIERKTMDIPTRDAMFAQGEFDFAFGYTNTTLPIMESKCDCTFELIGYADNGISPISNGYIVGNKFAKEEPKAVEAFAQATQESIQWVVDHPEEAVDHFFKFAKSSKLPPEVVAAQWAATEELLFTDASEGMEYGCMAETDWEDTIALLEQYGGVEAGSVSPDQAFDNSYLGNCE